MSDGNSSSVTSSCVELHRYVPVGKAMEFARLGWMPMPTFQGTVHEAYSVHMIWRCCCGTAEPDPYVMRAKARAIVKAKRQTRIENARMANLRR